jgi:predicted enzyme related to lactoylglutathione lyase
MSEFVSIVPVIRIFDVAKAKEFYAGYLGFAWDWEHRFDERAPLYAQVSRGPLQLHLSEHHGDGSPGAVIQVMMTGIEDYHRELAAKNYGHMRPGLSDEFFGRLVQVWDPFGNRIRFIERKAG